MLVVIDDVLDSASVRRYREQLEGAEWVSGSETAGSLARNVKHNLQLAPASDIGNALGADILQRLSSHPTFISAALPRRFFPPRFNCYQDEGLYGAHIDGSLMQIAGTADMLRTDISCTLFLSAPEEYTGGELCIEGHYGSQAVKLAPGQLVMYPSTSLHQVKPVTSGRRLASFFWLQSMVRDHLQRDYLYTLDQSIQSLTSQLGVESPDVVRLSGLYHNLIRQWADA